MGFWEISTNVPLQQPTESTSTFATPYSVYQHYFGQYTTDGKPYNLHAFKTDVKEARNHGLRITSDLAHAMRLLAKHGSEWFNADGTLREGLSRRDAEKARLYKSTVNQFYNRIKPRQKKKEKDNSFNTKARWAANNFVLNGFDTEAAKSYAGISNYNGLAQLWGILSGNPYDSSTAIAELNYYDSLSAPQKRAYLNQRKYWVNSGMISPKEGYTIPSLIAPSNADMTNYIRDHITDWHNIFYGNNGFEDEYVQANPVLDDNTKKFYQLYGITPSALSSATWTPASSVRTSGFAVSAKAKLLTRREQEGTQGGTLLVDKAKQLINNSGIEDPSSVKIEEKNGKLYIDGEEMTLDLLKQICN